MSILRSFLEMGHMALAGQRRYLGLSVDHWNCTRYIYWEVKPEDLPAQVLNNTQRNRNEHNSIWHVNR